jgi:hydroxyacylglutathione hydrolase
MEIAKGLHAFVWRDFQVNNCNTYLIRGSKNILIDPGLDQLFGGVKAALAELNLSPSRIDLVIITHGHYDHMGAADTFDGIAPVAMSHAEYEFLEMSASGHRGFSPDILLEEGEIELGDLALRIIPAPGHSPGSVCIYWPERKALFSGDVVFSRSIGRTDLPGGRSGLLKESIQRIAELDIDYLLPGHGEIVTGRQAVRENFKIIEKQWFGYLTD